MVGKGPLGTIAFGALSGGIGAELTGGNFFQGFVIGGVVAGLNHEMHPNDDNGYDQNGKKVNNKGGDKTDYLYDANGNEIASTSVKISFTQGGELSTSYDGYGFRNNTIGTGGALYDAGWDATSMFMGLGELKAGFTLFKNGVTLLSKAELGFKVGLGASKGTLKSSVIAKSIYGSKQINLFGGIIKSLPTIIKPYSTTYWSSFYGRNATLFGGMRMGLGGTLIYSNTRTR